MCRGKNNFRLDSICPTGFGKVAGVKIENDDGKWAGGAEVGKRFDLWSAAMNGIGREKTRKAQDSGQVAAARGRPSSKFENFRGFSPSIQNIVVFTTPLGKMPL